jgi:hypothetical protein
MKRYSLAAALAFALHAVPGWGQAQPDSVKLRNDCRLATQVLRTGNPAPRLQWATAFIRRCGADALAQANVAALQRLSSEPNFETLSLVWNQLQYVRDARVYETALAIADDRDASVAARVHALIWLVRLRAPDHFVDLQAVTGGFDSAGRVLGGCGRYSHLAGASPWYDGEPLPSDSGARIAELGGTLAADQSQPIDVRTAARCARSLGFETK